MQFFFILEKLWKAISEVVSLFFSLPGPVFIYSSGNIVNLHVNDPELVKEIGHSKPSDLGKPAYMQRERGPLFGRGILSSNGPLWAHQRKIIAPELYMDKVKVFNNCINWLACQAFHYFCSF